jgi:hypothetical protein
LSGSRGGRLGSPSFYTMTFEEVENLCQPFVDMLSINWIGSLEELS